MPIEVTMGKHKLTFPDGTSQEEIQSGMEDYEAKVYKDFGVKEDTDLADEAETAARWEVAKMGGGKQFMTGIGRGMTNLARQAGNIVGMVSDEDIEAAKEKDKYLLDTAYGSAGSIVGEIAPMMLAGGPVGAGLRAAGVAGKALPYATAAVEGAGAGALLAGPGERTSGAAIGAAGGGVAAGLGQTLKRMGTGVVKETDEVAKMRQMMRHAGQDDFIGVGEAAQGQGGPAGLLGYAYRNLLPMMPLAGGALEKQGAKTLGAFRKTAIRQAYGKHADDIFRELDETGDVLKALEKGEISMMKAGSNRNAQARGELMDAAGRTGEPYGQFGTRDLMRSNQGKALRDISHSMQNITKTGPESTIAARNAFYGFTRSAGLIGDMLFGGGMVTLGSRAATTKAVQRFFMGNTSAQKKVMKLISEGKTKEAMEILGRALRLSTTAETVGE